MRIENKYMSVNIFFTWKHWGFGRQIRFNNGNPFTDYDIGPLNIHKFRRGYYISY